MAKRRCFISARYGLDVSLLQRALEENDVEWQWAQDLPLGASIMDSVSAAINASDFVVGVFSEKTLSPNIALEIPIA
jgi:hypothetical protein